MEARELAGQVMARIEELARISEEPGLLTRIFGSPEMRRANDLVGAWMREAGMVTTVDAIGNLIGRYPGSNAAARTLMLGSHLDTVRDAGKFDGPLGVLTAIAAVARLDGRGVRLPCAVEVVGFADEEGVRYQTTYLGSKALAGCFNQSDLARVDAKGIPMADAIRGFGGDPGRLASARRDPRELLGYVEVHIEQGPVLENERLPVGVVTAIAGQTRIRTCFIGVAGHAGTVPMKSRRDALAAAARFVAAVEEDAQGTPGLVATVGQLEVQPGASNVIPGKVKLSLDIRHENDDRRQAAAERLRAAAESIGALRGLAVEWEVVHQARAVSCSEDFSEQLARAVANHVPRVLKLASGAGHDAAIMGAVTPMAMLFVRCRGGISHHPDESVELEDVRVALEVMGDFLLAINGD